MNAAAVLVIALAAVVGALFFGSWLLGLLIGLLIVLAAFVLPLIRP